MVKPHNICLTVVADCGLAGFKAIVTVSNFLGREDLRVVADLPATRIIAGSATVQIRTTLSSQSTTWERGHERQPSQGDRRPAQKRSSPERDLGCKPH